MRHITRDFYRSYRYHADARVFYFKHQQIRQLALHLLGHAVTT